MRYFHATLILALIACAIPLVAGPRAGVAAPRPSTVSADSLRAAFTAEFSGAVSGTLRGKAMFDARTVDGDSYFKIILYRHSDDRNFEAFNIVGFDMLLPSEGQIVLPDNEQFTAAYMAVADGVTKIGALESGWIRLEKAEIGRAHV